ncbi:hypothetical protein V8G54_030093 [Vigna mungo]|uniref:Uncharacterized protein n=1 Tax=Vigna mungo TaxID=3915 RepID=A0AAQ3MVL9_VIGMU
MLRDPHLLPHDLSRRHGSSWLERRHGARERAAGGTNRRGGHGGNASADHPPGRTPLHHPQPQHLLHPAHRLRHHLVRLPPICPATVALMVGIKREGMAAPEPWRGPARCEKYLVGRLPHLVIVKAVELAEWPGEGVGVGAALAVDVVVQTGGGGGRVGLAASVVTHGGG